LVGHVEAFARRGLGIGLRLERDRVELQGEQHVSDFWNAPRTVC